MLLEDYHLLEKLGQFNREKIPERVVHARGMGAKGFFEVRTALECGSMVVKLLALEASHMPLLSSAGAATDMRGIYCGREFKQLIRGMGPPVLSDWGGFVGS